MKIPEIIIVETVHQPGSLARVLQVIADAGLAIEHLTALRREQGRTLWEITLEMDEEADRSLYARIDQLPTARLHEPRRQGATVQAAEHVQQRGGDHRLR